MKRVLTLLATLLLSTFVFANTYKVEKVSGKVFLIDKLGNQTVVEVGQALSSEDIIKIGFDSKVILSGDGITAIIKTAVSAAPVEILFNKNKPKKGSLKKASISKASDVGAEVTGSRSGVSTAASRASDAKEDLDWAE